MKLQFRHQLFQADAANAVCAAFRDSGFAGSHEKINVFEIFKLLAPNATMTFLSADRG